MALKTTAASAPPTSSAPRYIQINGQGSRPIAEAPIATPPFYGMDISITSKFLPLPVITFGGLRIDERSGMVLDEKGQAIPGLYAAGRTAVGVASNTYVSGLSFADCVFSGRRVARHVARANR